MRNIKNILILKAGAPAVFDEKFSNHNPLSSSSFSRYLVGLRSMLQTVPHQLANIVCAWKYHKLMLSPL